MTLSAETQRILKEWKTNSPRFVWDNFRVEPDAWQLEALDALDDPAIQRISLQACVGPGKTAFLAWASWKWFATMGDLLEHPKGAAVATTYQNLQDNLWPELSKWQERSPYLMNCFDWNKERICSKDHPATWFMSARSWPKTANAEAQGRTLSGLHSKFPLIIIDESGDIPLPVLKAGEQALSTCVSGKIIQAGNPTSLEGMLHVAANEQAHLWKVIRITGDPDDPRRSPRISLDWSKEQINTYGRDDPWVMSSLLGLFPPCSINALISPDAVRTAMERHLQPDQYNYVQKRLGIDNALFGDDCTVLFPRQGLALHHYVEMRHATGPEVAARAALARQRWEWEVAFVDATGGYGASTIDAMNLAGLPNFPVQYSGKPDDPRYFNKRTENYFRFKQAILDGAALPNSPQLLREICAHTYTLKSGKLLLQPKALVKVALKCSPDHSDAASNTYALVDCPATLATPQNLMNIAPQDYDPFVNS